MFNLKKLTLSVLFLPLLLTIDLLRSHRSIFRKIFLFFIIWIFIGSTWIKGYQNMVQIFQLSLYDMGITDKIINIPVEGTSMLPTIKDGEDITLHSPKKYPPQRGDIVSFYNRETAGLYYLKRVIGLPGEKIMIKNGAVSIDGKTLHEEYVYNNESTYGNAFLLDCESHTIPQGKVAVLGDNRTVSMDSRVIGFVNLSDIDGVIKTHTSVTFAPSLSTSSSVKNIDLNKFIEILNSRRKTKGVAALLLQPVLSDIALTRAKYIATDVSRGENIEPLDSALERSKYDYLLIQEFSTMGNYSEDQLVDHVLGLVPYGYDLESDKYYEAGVGVGTMTKGECQIPLVNVILSWPAKPSDSQNVANGFQRDIEIYTQILTSLRKLKDNTKINTQETQRLIDSFTSLLNEANRIRTIALESRWLSSTESEQGKNYLNQVNSVKQELANYVRKYESAVTDESLKTFVADFKWGNQEFNDESNNAKLFFGQGKYQELLSSANTLLKLATNNQEKAIGYYWQGLAYYNFKQVGEAEKSLGEAIKNDPTYAAPNVTMAAISFAKQDYQTGLQYALKCQQLDPNYGWCYNNMGIGYFNLGQRDKAIEAMEKAVSLDSTSYVFNDNLKRMKSAP